MQILLVNACQSNTQGKDDFSNFRRSFDKCIRKLKKRSFCDLSLTIYSKTELIPILSEPSTAYSSNDTLHKFQSFDIIVISCGNNYLPWSENFSQVDCLVRMCLRHDKPLYAEGSAMLSLVAAASVGPQQYYVFNDVFDPSEASLSYLRSLEMNDRSKLEAVDMFLDAATGDLYERQELKGFWAPFRNIGMHNCALADRVSTSCNSSDAIISQAQAVALVSRPSTRGCEKRDATRLVRSIGGRPGNVPVSRLAETAVFVANSQDPLTKTLPSAFLAFSHPRWRVNSTLKSPAKVLIDSDLRGPQAVRVGECIGVFFAVNSSKYPETEIILHRFMEETTDRVIRGDSKVRRAQWALYEPPRMGLPRIRFDSAVVQQSIHLNRSLGSNTQHSNSDVANFSSQGVVVHQIDGNGSSIQCTELACEVTTLSPIYFPEWSKHAELADWTRKVHNAAGCRLFVGGFDSANNEPIEFSTQTLADAMKTGREFASAAKLVLHEETRLETTRQRQKVKKMRQKESNQAREEYYRRALHSERLRRKSSMFISNPAGNNNVLDVHLTSSSMHDGMNDNSKRSNISTPYDINMKSANPKGCAMMPDDSQKRPTDGSFESALLSAHGLKFDEIGTRQVLHQSRRGIKPAQTKDDAPIVRISTKETVKSRRRLLASLGVMSIEMEGQAEMPPGYFVGNAQTQPQTARKKIPNESGEFPPNLPLQQSPLGQNNSSQQLLQQQPMTARTTARIIHTPSGGANYASWFQSQSSSNSRPVSQYSPQRASTAPHQQREPKPLPPFLSTRVPEDIQKPLSLSKHRMNIMTPKRPETPLHLKTPIERAKSAVNKMENFIKMDRTLPDVQRELERVRRGFLGGDNGLKNREHKNIIDQNHMPRRVELPEEDSLNEVEDYFLGE